MKKKWPLNKKSRDRVLATARGLFVTVTTAGIIALVVGAFVVLLMINNTVTGVDGN